jgi:multidrug efflux system outer membrane protein
MRASARSVLACGSVPLLCLAACTLAPEYVVPRAQVPPIYKETGPWAPASPADASTRGDWWSVYGDENLDTLERQLDESNPDLAAALSRYDQANSLVSQVSAALVPELDFSGASTRNRQSAYRPLRSPGDNFYSNNLLEGSISYEFDLWGRVRNEVASAQAGAQASNDDLASVRLSLEAKLAEAYFDLRGLDAQGKLLIDTIDAYTHALRLTVSLHTGGAASGLDVGRAQTQLQTATAQISEVAAQRAIREHEIAALIGVPPVYFSLASTVGLPPPPVVPVSAPSELLQRRPDIAAAERRAAAANAKIGVARAAYYPTISLDAAGGFQTSNNGVNLLNLASSFWTLGPAMALTVFDGGRRAAVVRSTRDQFDIASDSYRSTVLSAFQEVEDNLALCNDLAAEADSQASAVDAATHVESLALKRYQQGAVTYLDVVTAQTANLQTQRDALSIATRRLVASVGLIRALGGGWKSPAGQQVSSSIPSVSGLPY